MGFFCRVIEPSLISHPRFVFEYGRADRFLTAGKITNEIEERIRDADVIIAALSEDNLNVFYELGFAHGAKRKNILLKQQTIDKKLNCRLTSRITEYTFMSSRLKGLTT